MRQLIYISTLSPRTVPDLDAILRVSQANNRRDGITGLLFFNGKRFLQALEGEDTIVASTIDRIRRDARHRAIVILSDRDVSERGFGEWAMADGSRAADAPAAFARIAALTARAAPSVRATFAGYADIAA